MKAKLLAVFSALLGLVVGAQADGFIIIVNPPPFAPPFSRPDPRPFPPPPRPWPMPRPHYIFAPLEVVFHKVDVDINGQKAVTRVEQEFFNPNDANLEGEYIFPIPKG